MPRWLLIGLVALTTASLLPLACVARARVTRTSKPRVHLVRHMDQQISYKGDEASEVFAGLHSHGLEA